MMIKSGAIAAPSSDKRPILTRIFTFCLVNHRYDSFFTNKNQIKTSIKKRTGVIYPAISITPEESQFNMCDLCFDML